MRRNAEKSTANDYDQRRLAAAQQIVFPRAARMFHHRRRRDQGGIRLRNGPLTSTASFTKFQLRRSKTCLAQYLSNARVERLYFFSAPGSGLGPPTLSISGCIFSEVAGA